MSINSLLPCFVSTNAVNKSFMDTTNIHEAEVIAYSQWHQVYLIYPSYIITTDMLFFKLVIFFKNFNTIYKAIDGYLLLV